MNYVVQYGRLAHIARAACEFGAARGDRVVIRGPRGLELGTVLCSSNDADPEASIFRHATLEDHAAVERNEALGLDILVAAGAAGLPISFIDSEVSLDRAAAVLHALPFAPCDASPLLTELSIRFDLAVQFLDLSRAPAIPDPPDPETMTCGKPDCGTGSGCTTCSTGGCSTGSCSRGSVKSAAELTAYFADLRVKMEAARTSLV